MTHRDPSGRGEWVVSTWVVCTFVWQTFLAWSWYCNFWGWGFAQIWRFFGGGGFHLPENGMFKPVFCADFWCADFCADFCAHLYADFWCADLCADFRADFGALKIGVPESCKNAQKICGKICGVPMAMPRGVAHSVSAFSSRQHVAQSPPGRPTYSRRACERPPWHFWAERHAWICSKTLRKIRSAKH